MKERFATEILPHFAVEELLLSALEGQGVDDLVKRTRDEHARMADARRGGEPRATRRRSASSRAS